MRRPSLLLVMLVVNAGLLLLYVLAPRWRGPLFREDGAVENATALLFLASFIMGTAGLIAHRADRYRALLFLGAALGLIGFLDEISFGARLVGWSMPAMPGGGELDGVHDFMVLAYRLGVDAGPVVLGASLLIIAALTAGAALRWRRPLSAQVRRIVTDPIHGASAAFVVCLAVASIVDLGDGTLRHLGAVEETLELNAGAVLLLSMLLTMRPNRRRAKPRERHRRRAGSSAPV